MSAKNLHGNYSIFQKPFSFSYNGLSIARFYPNEKNYLLANVGKKIQLVSEVNTFLDKFVATKM